MYTKVVLSLFLAGLAAAQPATLPKKKIALRCGTLIDTRGSRAVPNAVVLIEGDRVTAAGSGVAVPAGVETVDLTKPTCLPRFIVNHPHPLLQGDTTPASYDYQF